MPSQESKPGCIGFQCPYGNGALFEYCLHECQHRCLSLPLILALMREHEVEPGVYSITELPHPRQQVFLKRHFRYYIDPFFSTFALLGTAVHSIIENQREILKRWELDGDYRIEEAHRIEFHGITLSGRPDLYEASSKTLYDYKTIKVYAMAKLLDGKFDESDYTMQLNAYKWFFYPDAESLMIEAFIKDWTYNDSIKYNMKPLERVQIPILPREEVEKAYADMIDGHLEVEEEVMKHLEAPYLPRCTYDEVWYNENPRSPNCGIPIRCRDYCEVNTICEQYRTFLEETDERKRAGIYPKR